MVKLDELEDDAALRPSQVATLFKVDPKTVGRWAKAGKLSSVRTLGGHRRFRAGDVRSALASLETASSR